MWKKISEQLDGLVYFGVASVASLLEIENAVAGQLLSRWVKNGRVIRLKRGIYMSREYWVRHARDDDFTSVVATVINPNCYLSKEYVLQQHSIMTEAVYGVTAITTKNTSKVANKIGSFLYYHIQGELFGGYSDRSNGVITYRVATLGKALFDYLYFRPHGWAYGEKSYNLREDLRLNLEELTETDWSDFDDWVAKSGSKKMKDAQSNIRRNL